jgi:putative transcriptional regulator
LYQLERFFNISKLNRSEPKKGSVLISEPFLEDNFFKRSVIYLCEHNEDGSYGFVLNNLLTVHLGDVLDGLTDSDFQIAFGGPVNSSSLFFLHKLGDKIDNSQEVENGLFTGGDFESIKSLIQANVIEDSEIRFFLGYSGWTAGQLDEEIKNNAWIVCEDFAFDVLTSSDKSMWKDTLKEMGGQFKVIANFPEDPALN